MQRLIRLLLMLFFASPLMAQIDDGLADLRPLSNKILRAVQLNDFERIMALRLQKSDVQSFKKMLEDVRIEAVNTAKLLEEIQRLESTWDEFDNNRLDELSLGWNQLSAYIEEKKINVENSKFLYDLLEVRKKAPFQSDAEVTIVLSVEDDSGKERTMGVVYRAIQVGKKWILMGGIGPSPRFENFNDEENEEAVAPGDGQ